MVSNELIIGDIINCLKQQIFNFETPSVQELYLMEREKGLKAAINRSMNQITEFGLYPGIEKRTERQRLKSEKCIENLCKYVKELMGELEEKKIKAYCQAIPEKSSLSILPRLKPFEVDHIFLITNSFHTAISTEILWAPKVTISQAIKISRGEIDLDELGDHLPELIKDVKKELIPYLKTAALYHDFAHGIEEALTCYQKKLFKGCNLIIMTTIEGMVRKLANYLAPFHGLESDFSDSKYLSLNTLLRNVKWKCDFKISSTSLMLIIGDDRTLRRQKPFPKIGESYQMVSLDTRLDFLKGRFKDDRDLILHGSHLNYNKQWNLFLNFSALMETMKVCRYYDKKYGHNNPQ